MHVGVALTMGGGRRTDSLSDTRCLHIVQGTPPRVLAGHKSCEMFLGTLVNRVECQQGGLQLVNHHNGLQRVNTISSDYDCAVFY